MHNLIVYAIVVKDNDVSERGFEKLVQSSKDVGNKFKIQKFNAITPDNVKAELQKTYLQWTWPWMGQEPCMKTGLTKSAYQTADPNKRIACFVSHYHLWLKIHQNYYKPMLILEHDAEFIKKLDLSILDTPYDIIGINDPIRATRRAGQFKDTIIRVYNQAVSVCPIPRIDDWQVPQGLAGNSAYIMKPKGAKNVIDKAREIGAWPNDALMCYQNIPNMGVTTDFYTRVQGLPSLTTQ